MVNVSAAGLEMTVLCVSAPHQRNLPELNRRFKG